MVTQGSRMASVRHIFERTMVRTVVARINADQIARRRPTYLARTSASKSMVKSVAKAEGSRTANAESPNVDIEAAEHQKERTGLPRKTASM